MTIPRTILPKTASEGRGTSSLLNRGDGTGGRAPRFALVLLCAVLVVGGASAARAQTTTSSTSTSGSASPSISIAVSAAAVGTNDTVTGLNFTASGTISVDIGTVPVTCADPTIGSNGSFSCAFTVPALSASGNPYNVTATDSSSLTSSTTSAGTPVTFAVEPSISLLDSTAAPAVNDTVTGSGFTASSNISVALNGTAVTCAESAVGSNGSFSCTFTSPSSSGDYPVSANDSAGVTSSVTPTGATLVLDVSSLTTSTTSSTSTSSTSSTVSTSTTTSSTTTSTSSSSIALSPSVLIITTALALTLAALAAESVRRRYRGGSASTTELTS